MLDEKIIWKFQTMLSLFDTTIDQLTQEKNSSKTEFDDLEKFYIRSRNELIAGIGFGISLLLILIQMELLPSHYVLYVIILVVLGLALFTVFNEYIQHRLKIYKKLNRIYVKIIYNELFPLEQYFVSEALSDQLDEKKILDYANELSTLSQIQSFCLKYFGHKNFRKHNPPNLSEYENLFQEIKNANLSKFSINSIKDRYSEFIKNFSDLQK